MIVRIWRGEATAENAAAYHRHVTQSVFPSLRQIPGHRGACLLRRSTSERVEFLVMTLWESMEAVKRFAGENAELAVVEPAAKTVLADFDSFVKHFELAYGSIQGDAL